MDGSIVGNFNLMGTISGGGDGGVSDVTLGGESVVNAQGVAQLPPYPEIPDEIVKDVLVNDESVVGNDDIARITIPEMPDDFVEDVTINGESVVNPNTHVAQIVFPTPINYVEGVEQNGESVVNPNTHIASINTLIPFENVKFKIGSHNNKDVYFISLNVQRASTSTSIDISQYNIDTILMVTGVSHTNGNYDLVDPYYESSAWYSFIEYNKTTKELLLYSSGNMATDTRGVTVNIIYTEVTP